MLGNEILKKENALTGAKKGQENHCFPLKKELGTQLLWKNQMDISLN